MIAYAHAPEAESALLGSVMLDADGQAFDRAVDAGISWQSFTDERQQLVWKALTNLRKQEIGFDPTTVATEFAILQARGGHEFNFNQIVDELVKPFTNEVGSAANADYYKKLVRKQERCRSLRCIAGELVKAAFLPNDELYEAVESISNRLSEFVSEANPTTSDAYEPFALGSILNDAATWEPVERIETGFVTFDDELGGGLRVGGVHAFTGPTGNGKSQTVAQIAANTASNGTPVAFVSLELSRVDIARLIVAQYSGIDRHLVGDPSRCQTDSQKDAIKQAIECVSKWPLTILDDDFWRRGLSRTGLSEIVADGVKRFGWRMVVVDYVGLMEKADGDASDYGADVANSTAFKRIARKHSVALLAVVALRKSAAFNKSVNSGTEITLDDILGAGRFVYDCENVFAVTCEHLQRRVDDAAGRVSIRTLKSRFSAPGTLADLNWFPRCGRIIESS